MIISYSEIFRFQTCPRQHYYRFVLGKRPVTESQAINTGNNGHILLDIAYNMLAEGKSKEEIFPVLREKVIELVDKALDRGHIDITSAIAETLIENYFNTEDLSFKTLYIENRFLLPLSRLTDDPFYEDIEIGFTPDVVFERVGGFIDIEDSKFVQKAWGGKKLERYTQTKYYHIFMESIGYAVSINKIRFFNVATGKTYTKPYTLTKDERDILVEDLLRGIRPLVEHKRQTAEELAKTPRIMNYMTCERCSFNFVCSREAEGKDMSKTLAIEFEDSRYDYSN